MDGTIVGVFGIAFADVIQMTIGVAIWIQLVVAVLAYRREKKLDRKEDTLREYRALQSDLISVRRRLTDAKVSEDGDVQSVNAESVEDTMADILRLLNAMEYLATGINSGAFDREILHSLTATSFIQDFIKYRPIIDMLRAHQRNPNLYIEYEHASSDMARVNLRRLR